MSREFEERIVEEIEEEVRSLLKKARETERRKPMVVKVYYGLGSEEEVLERVAEGCVVILPVDEKERVARLLRKVRERFKGHETYLVKTPSIIIAPPGAVRKTG